jgi:hypothetical protein
MIGERRSDQANGEEKRRDERRRDEHRNGRTHKHLPRLHKHLPRLQRQAIISHQTPLPNSQIFKSLKPPKPRPLKTNKKRTSRLKSPGHPNTCFTPCCFHLAVIYSLRVIWDGYDILGVLFLRCLWVWFRLWVCFTLFWIRFAEDCCGLLVLRSSNSFNFSTQGTYNQNQEHKVIYNHPPVLTTQHFGKYVSPGDARYAPCSVRKRGP